MVLVFPKFTDHIYTESNSCRMATRMDDLCDSKMPIQFKKKKISETGLNFLCK